METDCDGGAGQSEGTGSQEACGHAIKNNPQTSKQNASGGKYRP
jgi:hypothetical protein